ncbi:MAG: hypothetical protein HC904_02660 [Blastochloris sp.]|nr:hypothetical protein [Blastochloris sp.]
MAGLWLWEKIFGAKEWVLRSFNIPWLLLGCWGFLYYWRVTDSFKFTALACLLFSPFTWFYLDEARPYVMQIGAGVLTVCATHHLIYLRDPKKLSADLLCFLAATLILSLASLFAMVLAFLFYLVIMTDVLFRPRHGIEYLTNKVCRLLLGTFAIPFCMLAGYYLWTLSLGAKASGVGGTGLLNLPFAVYEIAGFSGLGPDRNRIRADLMGAFFSHLFPLLLGLSAYALVVVSAWQSQSTEDRKFRIVWASGLGLLLVGAVVSWLVGWFGGFRLLGRHLAPMFPLAVVLFGAVLLTAWRIRLGRRAVLLLVAVLLFSCFNQRFHPRLPKIITGEQRL